MTPKAIFAGLTLLAAVAAPFLVGPYAQYILAMAAIYGFVGLGMYVLLGLGGQISLGHAAFWALGAYGSAVLTVRFGVPFPLAVIGGAVIAGVFGAIAAMPALRVQGHYLAIATLGLAIVVQQVLFQWDSVTGGRQGMLVPRPSLFGYEIDDDGHYYLIILACLLVAIWLVRNFQKSFLGISLKALRSSPIAAQAAGVGRAYHLIVAFVVSAALTGVSGAFYGALLGQLSTDSFTLLVSLDFLTMAVIGGLGSIGGALVGGIFYAVAPEILRDFQQAQQVIYGLLLIACMRLLPGGLASLPHAVATLFSSRRKSPPENNSSVELEKLSEVGK
ncbi:MAG: branched-chain amino acid ABC transporter permease [Rhizobiaceae bacterium]|jgi:branched-chain amino acid transport system permease protein|nr:MAG: branched-chain amino acid ABC transporter permease [Rhizobiaceae bacterium]